MITMLSPFKLFEEDLNIFKIADNPTLGDEIRDFFNNSENEYLWKINTHRQYITPALRHTESIHIRNYDGMRKNATTQESNQHVKVKSSELAEIPIFEKSINWFNDSLLATGAKSVELGRVFISKLIANQSVGLHTDEGKYFSHYDRFHFAVTAAPDNEFVINDESYVLEQDCLYWVNNHVPHWLKNNSSIDRINFIIDARLT